MAAAGACPDRGLEGGKQQVPFLSAVSAEGGGAIPNTNHTNHTKKLRNQRKAMMSLNGNESELNRTLDI